jgi:Flp pilus assembly protein TadG
MRRLRGFGPAEQGTVFVLFALSIVPLMGLVGAAVDYGRALVVRNELTATLDAAVLAATQAKALDDHANVEQIVRDFVTENYTRTHQDGIGAEIVVNTPTISAEGELTATIDADVGSTFLRLVGIDSMPFSIASSAKVGGQTLELALALDNTLSMKGAKLEALKSSATMLVDTLMVGGGDKVKIALVPFADYVNIGTENRYNPGLDIPEDYVVTKTTPGGEWCRNEYPSSTQVCTPIKEWGTCYTDGVPYDCQKVTGYNCTGSKGDPVWTCTPYDAKTTTTSYKWYGCMGSRPHPLNVQDDNYGTGVPGIMATSNWCKSIAKVTRLTNSKGAITSGINEMKTDRWTYIPGGLIWGWRAISDQGPFADGVSFEDNKVKKAIVLMTDGENTLLRKKVSDDSTKNHDGEVWMHSIQKLTGAPETDTFTSELCENIKAKGIILHTIAYDVEAGSPVQTLLKNCAGNGGQYFDAADSEQLAEAFHKIAVALLNLRLSK